jgi:hypothetical protein
MPSHAEEPASSFRVWIAAMCLAATALLLWVPALSTPFWGDDYLFLADAFRARLHGEPWWIPFWPDTRYQFWRPLGHETYWRFVEGILGSDPWAAHLMNLCLWALDCLSVGLLGAMLARAMRWNRAMPTGALAAAIYGVLALHFTPIHWTSSADSLLIVLWTALSLSAWTASPASHPRARAFLAGSIPALQLLALFSKESAVVMPLLMACMSALIWPRNRPGRPELAAWVVSVSLIAAWLALRGRFIHPPPPQYALAFEGNVLRNIASLVAWGFNVPREALRMMILGPRETGLAWAFAAALPMAAFLWISAGALWERIRPTRAAPLAAFLLVAYAPYFFLSWQSYEYYAQVAAILPAVVVARGTVLSGHRVAALALLALSSFIAVEGSRMAPYPGLIARANGGEEQLARIVAREILDPGIPAVSAPLTASVANAHEFYAIGKAGLAWRLARPESEVAVVEECRSPEDVLVVFRGGDVTFMDCATHEPDDFVM